MLGLLFCQSCSADDSQTDEVGLDGITISNFPIIDGSDSTTPLRYILMCHSLGFSYEWGRYPFTQEGVPRIISPNYTCSDDEQHHIHWDCMKESNTHQSFVNLIDDSVELILTARSISRDEKVYADNNGVNLTEKPIARDALTFIVNTSNPVDNISIKQLQGIYTGKITNWKEVGGNDLAITPYIRNRNSGSQEKFETMVMAGLTIAELPEMQIGTTMLTPYYQMEQDVSGIGFTPFYYFSVLVDNGKTKSLGIDGVDMTKANVESGKYPYLTDVYAIVRSDIDKSSVAYQLFEFLTTTAGQAIVEESGYIPLEKSSGIQTVKADAASSRVFSLDGKSIGNSLNALPQGIYIQNGRKLFHPKGVR